MTLFLITGASGTGKTTLANVLKKANYWKECISCTTRPMREGEEDGTTYHFMTEEEFMEIEKENLFAETVIYDDNHYGITKEEIKEKTKKGHAYIIVDFDGYKQVKAIYPDAVGIFLYMSKEDCLANMLLRGDSIASSMKRIEKYDKEIENRQYFPYVIKNVRDKQNATGNLLKNLIYQY